MLSSEVQLSEFTVVKASAQIRVMAMRNFMVISFEFFRDAICIVEFVQVFVIFEANREGVNGAIHHLAHQGNVDRRVDATGKKHSDGHV